MHPRQRRGGARRMLPMIPSAERHAPCAVSIRSWPRPEKNGRAHRSLLGTVDAQPPPNSSTPKTATSPAVPAPALNDLTLRLARWRHEPAKPTAGPTADLRVVAHRRWRGVSEMDSAVMGARRSWGVPRRRMPRGAATGSSRAGSSLVYPRGVACAVSARA
jgi:hypothetical protein